MTVRPRLLAGAAAGAFAVGLGAVAILQHRAFWTGRFDLGNLTQAVWSTAHGDLLETTSLRGPQMSRLGAHFDPIVAALAPLWWLWPDASLLLAVQAAAVAAGAVPVFALARRRLESEWAAAGFALAYLLYPATQWLVLDDFHPVALATPLLLWAFWLLDRDRLLAFAGVAALACLSKEQIGLVVAAMGVWYAVRPGRRLAGLAIAAAGTAVSLAAIAVVVPHFAPGGGSPFAGRYADVGGTPTGVAETLVTDPGAVLAELAEGRDVGYLAALLLPLLGLPLLAPLAALTALPELALNLLSDTRTQTSIHFHYTAGAIPGLVVASILGAERLVRWAGGAGVVPRALVAATLVAGVVLGPLPLWRHVPYGQDLATREHVVGDRARAMARAVALVPADAAVSATNDLGAHLSERRRILSFPVLGDAEWILVDTVRPSYRDRIGDGPGFRRALAAVRAMPNVRVVHAERGVLVLRREPVRAGSSAAAGTR